MISGLHEMCASFVLHCWNSENVLNVYLRQETPEYRPLPFSVGLKFSDYNFYAIFRNFILQLIIILARLNGITDNI